MFKEGILTVDLNNEQFYLEQGILKTNVIFPLCTKNGGRVIAVSSFTNLIYYKVSFLPDSFISTRNCQQLLSDTFEGHNKRQLL